MKNKSALNSRYFTYIKPENIKIIKNYGSIGFTLIIMAVFILFAIKPTIETILVLQKKLEDSKQVLDSLNKKATDLSSAKNNFDNMDEEIIEKINNAIPDNVGLATITTTIQEIVEVNNASISAIQFQPVSITKFSQENAESINEINFSLSAEGTYPNIISLLHQLQTSSRVFSIESASLNKASEGPGVILAITAKAFHIK